MILETGFGTGNNFLATWSAWRDDPQRCPHLFFIAIEKHPLQHADLATVHEPSAAPALAARLLDAWPTLTPGLHTLAFDEPELQARVTLLLALGDVADVMPALLASVDAFYLEGTTATEHQDVRQDRWLSRLGRLAAPDATAAAAGSASSIRGALQQAGFVLDQAGIASTEQDITLARYAPRFTPPPLPGGLHGAPRARHAVVVGAGLAGCAAAWALTREGWRVTLLDRHDAHAQEASGNPGGLFHGIVHGTDGIHARVHRAAALSTAALAGPWMDEGRLAGHAGGLMRLEAKLTDDEAQALLSGLGWPADHLRWLPRALASEMAGVPLPSGAWLFGQGGWLQPATFASLMLEEARQTGRLVWQGKADVRGLHHRVANGQAAATWQALDQHGSVLASGDSMVLACAMGVNPLLHSMGATPLPLTDARGQLSVLPVGWPGLQRPTLPITGGGYALSLADGRVLCGATNQLHDADHEVRNADHLRNLRQAAHLGVAPDDLPSHAGLSELWGRVGWRATTPDRLPLIGAVHAPGFDTHGGGARRMDQVRLVPRLRDADGGLYVLSGLGSRGIGWAALAGRLLTHWMEGTPCPVEADLRDALDPARFAVRRWRGGQQGDMPSSHS